MGDPTMRPCPLAYPITPTRQVRSATKVCPDCQGWGDLVDITAELGAMRKTCPRCLGEGEIFMVQAA